jgi:hypothetical protein
MSDLGEVISHRHFLVAQRLLTKAGAGTVTDEGKSEPPQSKNISAISLQGLLNATYLTLQDR